MQALININMIAKIIFLGIIEFMTWWFDEYEPDYVVGDLRLGPIHTSFTFNCIDPKFEFNTYREALKVQATLVGFEQERIIAKIKEHLDRPADEITLGHYFCAGCQRLVNLFDEQWSVSMCLSCSLDYGSKIHKSDADK